jgi:endoglucanase
MKRMVTAVVLVMGIDVCGAEGWSALWRSYAAAFLDDQVRVIDHDERDRTTSEGQAYALFFALVANERERFDRLLRWTERNLAGGDLTSRLPAWLWGRAPDNQWRVLDDNAASDADLWMAYTLLEAGEMWREPRYSALGTALANRVASEEVVQIPGLGTVLLPGPKGFQQDDGLRLNASYIPLQLLTRLATLSPDGPWGDMTAYTPTVIRESSPRGFATDWVDYHPDTRFTPSPVGSYDAIRVYLWAGMLDPATPGRDGVLNAVAGMARHLRSTQSPPAKVTLEGRIEDRNGPPGFSAALVPYLLAVGEEELSRQQEARLQSSFNAKSGLYGNPARYYDQNLALFAVGWRERQFWFDAQGRLMTRWKQE